MLIDNFDKLDESLEEALQVGCNKWAPGIEIIAVRVTKPKVPASISENYETRELEKTKLLIIKEQQKVREKGKPSELRRGRNRQARPETQSRVRNQNRRNHQ